MLGRRNEAGRLQKARQDMIGMDWANDDHQLLRLLPTALSSLHRGDGNEPVGGVVGA